MPFTPVLDGRVSVRQIQSGSEWWKEKNEAKVRKNLVLYSWATLAAKRFTLESRNLRVNGMYFEFENVATPVTPATVPAFDRTRSLTYYNNLSLDPDKDYLRIPLLASGVESTDETLFPDGNMGRFFAQTGGSTGVHGKTFSDIVNSKVYGLTLVAFADADDASQDILVSAYYFDVADQQLKLPTGQIGATWELEFD